METKLTTPATVETLVAALLRKAARDHVRKHDVTMAQVAEALQLLEIGAEVLWARAKWSVEVAFRVAEAVGVDVFDVLDEAVSWEGVRV